ncbi:kynurenine 3-monooxygenase [Aplysia californica]|uniref:Kynurenine 3-monooxygenase n=1 Tax=Aplysia californica TaxID=6500 RepID=A0ABM1ADZ0_APLCA|nr:kynurenine 3-monooxygenase [Aplysia californica]
MLRHCEDAEDAHSAKSRNFHNSNSRLICRLPCSVDRSRIYTGLSTDSLRKMVQEQTKHVAICGGGLVGALNACYMAQRGYRVDVYEMRQDIRTQEIVRGRSINLALSCRGREALKGVGLEETIVKNGIPMHARMIHDRDGKRRPILYGTRDQYIMSVDRRLLNEVLLTEAEKYENVKLHFNHKLLTCNFDTGEMLFQNEKGDQVKASVDLVVGTDGAFSAVRKQMMKLSRFDYQQTYIPHGYMELNIPPSADNEFAMEANYLHIWPRNEFMMIALPNLDRSFTTTLFMPFDIFSSITDERQLMDFFTDKFPDSIPLLGQEALKKSFLSSKPLPMVTVKCEPYHVKDKAVIMGDAAHALVPFYGQGMNCGFEDCIVLNDILDQCGDDFAKALPEYTRIRNVDAKAISDLAMYNYVEMRSSVNSKLFLIRKKLDNLLYKLFPKTWVPLYTMVSFTRIRYHECISRREWQDKVLTHTLRTAAVLGGVSLLVSAHALYRHQGALEMPGWLQAGISLVEGWVRG